MVEWWMDRRVKGTWLMWYGCGGPREEGIWESEGGVCKVMLASSISGIEKDLGTGRGCAVRYESCNGPA
jgi:hypothetical protein